MSTTEGRPLAWEVAGPSRWSHATFWQSAEIARFYIPVDQRAIDDEVCMLLISVMRVPNTTSGTLIVTSLRLELEPWQVSVTSAKTEVGRSVSCCVCIV